MLKKNDSRRKWRLVIWAGVLLLVLAFSENRQANAANLEDFYKSKVIQMIIPYSPGGGYDSYARMFAPYLAKHTGSKLIPKNVPGGGALIGVNTLYAAKLDGLSVGIINGTGMSLSQLTEQKGVKFDLNKFTWLGRIAAGDEFVYMGAKSPYKTFDALLAAKDKEVKWVTEGRAGSPYYRVVLVAELLKLNKAKIFTGYPGSAEANLAIIRGDADGTVGTYDSRQSQVDAGDFIPVVILKEKRSKEFPNVPTIFEVPGLDENDKKMARFLIGLDQLGRMLAAPPGLDKEKAQFLRRAVKKAAEDPELLAKSAKSKRPIEYASPEEVEQMVKDVLEVPAAIKKMIDDALAKY